MRQTIKKRAARQQHLFKQNDSIQPFLKWAGGKRQLLSEIRKYIPKAYGIYFEPFIGAGAVLFDIQPRRAVINDANKELINCYNAIKADPEGVILLAQEHQGKDSEEYFYRIRSLDRKPAFKKRSSIKRAARLIYLNKTCYNGLFRVNSRGQFNAPYGYYQNPQVVDALVIRAVSRYLNEAKIDIFDGDFEDAVSGAKASDFVYFDPPYHPLSQTSSFTGYNLRSFDKPHQEQLKRVCDNLTERGSKVLLSNSDTLFIRELYSDTTRYTIKAVGANRSINSVPTGRGKISELLIYNNYDDTQIKE